ncbi:MAG TPA: ABC transporter permease subunit [Candidatus Rifleibacterium sp.]|nr:ABC transporter permease subunit [Candidatus Rifleibacterium sp.]HPT44680.1 ABC transporter permease subunit [Candidatus Rifleibacterium sp.]
MTFRRLTIAIAVAVTCIYLVLVGSLFTFIDSGRLFTALGSDRVMFSIGLSVKAALIATFLAIIIAIPSAYALSRYNFPGKDLVDMLLELPLIVTPVALGAMLLIFFNTRTGVGLQQHIWQFVFEFSGIVLAQFLTTAGLAIRTIRSTFDAISPRYEAVACTLGATPARALFTITLPMARNGILAATVVCFAKCIGEFGATIMVAGAMPMKSETMPVSIFMRLGSADIEGMAMMILILLAVGLAVLLFLKFILRAKYD